MSVFCSSFGYLQFLVVICRFSNGVSMSSMCLCLFVGQNMSPHHSEQMPERSKVKKMFFLYVN